MAISGEGIYHPLAVLPRLSLVLLSLSVLVGSATLGCATTGGHSTGGSVGVLGLYGPEQALVLRSSKGTLRVQGRAALIEQLNLLVDARVRVSGPADSRRVTVRGFEILEAPDGLPPFLGELIVDQSGVRLEDRISGSALYLIGPSLKRLKSHHGADVWITGTVVGPQTLLVAHWGILTP
ncbi:MAG: hypothetical protein VX498_14865 [Myxococcota bacterium]|nr:hypothetical protein [Myxococcota bacterium]